MLYFSKLDYILDYISILLNIFQILIIILPSRNQLAVKIFMKLAYLPFIKFFFYTSLSLHFLIPFLLKIT